MKDTWLNHSVYSLLDRIANFQNYFSDAAQIIAATCFLMAIGMACIKIWLQASSAREQIIKLGMTLVVYLVMLHIYPTITKAILPFAQNLGYDVIFASGDYDVEIPSDQVKTGNSKDSKIKPTKQKFYKWLGEHTFNIFTTSTVQDNDESVRQALEINIVDGKSGRVDLNLTFKYCLAFFNVAWDTMPKIHITSFTSIMVGIIYIASVLVAIVCYIVVLINYVMALIDYYFMVGFGLFFLPLSLWDGTKQYSQALIGNFVKILVKLMIISTVLFLSIMSMIDMFVEVYMQSLVYEGTVLASSFSGVLQFCCTVIFQSLLLFVITKNTTQIASMLTGGEPQMSFGEFAHAVGQGIAVGAGATMAHRAMGKAALSVASGGASAIASGKATAAMAGHTKGDIAKSVMGSLGESVKGGLKNFNSENIGNTMDRIGRAGMQMGRMTGMSDFGGAEGGFMDPAMFTGRVPGSPGSSGGQAPQSNGGSENSAMAQNENANDLKGDRDIIPNTAKGLSAGVNANGTNGGTYNNAQWQRGNIGTYGDGVAKGDTASERSSSALTRYANRSTRSSGNISQFNSGMRAAFVGNAIKEIAQTRAQRAEGNKVGNGYMKAIARAGRNTITGAMAGLANRGNTLTSFNGNSYVTTNLGRMTTARDKNGNVVDMNSKNKVSSDQYQFVSNSPVQGLTADGPNDNDAVNIAQEATQNAQDNK